MAKKPVDNKKVETTGHQWDGIEELNNPLPRWWLWTFLVSIAFSIAYCVYYPSWPTLNGFLKGTAGWSQYSELNDKLAAADLKKAPFETKIANMSVEQINANPNLRNYAIASGRTDFALHCSQCHGAGANGAKGYPNLLDDEWLWGGSLSDILYTITHGVRSLVDDPASRDNGPMMAFVKDGVLTVDEARDTVRYVETLFDKTIKPSERTAAGKELYTANCAACHGEQGEGNREFGSPPLNNHIWLYGDDRYTLFETIANGRAGVMPAWGLKLSENTVKKLAVYVHSLGGGE